MTQPYTLIELPEVPSTSTWLKANADTLAAPAVVSTPCQTGGRGQRGNSWEAEPGMNLTFSILLRPAGVLPARQFFISEAVCLAVVDVLSRHLPPGADVRVKWPNDVYAGDRKICGILIEHALESATAIRHTVAGIGINVNQTRFVSDAPNPVSMRQITGREYPLSELLDQVVGAVITNLGADPAELHARYTRSLWRGDGEHPFATPGGERFTASIHGIDPAGVLTLRDNAGALRSFLFKEVSFLLS